MGMSGPSNLPNLSDAPIGTLIKPGYYKGTVDEESDHKESKSGKWGMNLKIGLDGEIQFVYSFLIYEFDWHLGLLRQFELAVGLPGEGEPDPVKYRGKKVGVYITYGDNRREEGKRTKPAPVYPQVKEFVPHDSDEVIWENESDDVPF